ncbi:helix-turn-helix transcriptional regulator [bacterium]|uniref:Helix-turn-helix transcriptional regulator n=1 Tax=Candidatus Scatenecus faecavium TaxID=2840915 RepID=A0A9D1K5C8_9BACT|nr:helix-turn-helix transcriptional regulator [bacterium]PWL81085.1 MAG: transcriptional regulator [Candidatus Gastranaerophilales bacterium]HIS83289.1 helix-turn-helix transcriptional regulator [Candidatus Scatenecus faecavium]
MTKKMDKVFHRKFGQRVRFLRKQKGMTQEQLSFEIDADNSYIANIENAHRDIPLSRVNKIAKTLGISLKELFDY